jgi:hypothetical protein
MATLRSRGSRRSKARRQQSGSAGAAGHPLTR